MKKVTVKNLNEVVTHQGFFETLLLATVWIERNKRTGVWGKPAGQYPQSKLSSAELETQISIVTEDPFGRTLEDPIVTIPDQFLIEITDDTDRVLLTRVQKRLKRMDVGRVIYAEFAEENSQRYEDGLITLANLDTIEQDTSRIGRLLLGGSLDMAMALMQQTPSSELLPSELKNKYLARLNDELRKLG